MYIELICLFELICFVNKEDLQVEVLLLEVYKSGIVHFYKLFSSIEINLYRAKQITNNQ
jgi:hypothetical protein